MDLETISIGATISLFDMEYDEEITYRLVGSTEANILENKISNESPIGKALIGKKIGEMVDVEGIDGISQFKILDIRR